MGKNYLKSFRERNYIHAMLSSKMYPSKGRSELKDQFYISLSMPLSQRKFRKQA
jgi:hypothetical protein